MRKFIDTIVLLFLLIGPAVILTCVRQPNAEEQYTLEQVTQDIEEDSEILVWNDSLPRP